MHRVDPLREGSGESVTSQEIGRLGSTEVPNDFPKKSHPYQWLGLSDVVFSLQEVKHHIEAHSLHAVRVPDVKLLIFQPQAQRPEARLRATAPGEIGTVIVDGKKRRIGVAAEIPPRKPRLAKNIHE